MTRLFILQNKNWNLVGFLIIVNHMYMNKDKSVKSCTVKLFALCREETAHMLVSALTC